MAPPTPSRMAWLRAAPSASPDPQACRAAIRCVESSSRLSISPNLQIGQKKPSEAHSRVQSLIHAHRGPLREFQLSAWPTEGPCASSKSPRGPARAPLRVQSLRGAHRGSLQRQPCQKQALGGPLREFKLSNRPSVAPNSSVTVAAGPSLGRWETSLMLGGPAGHFLRTFTVGVNRSAQLELALADKPHSVRKSAIK